MIDNSEWKEPKAFHSAFLPGYLKRKVFQGYVSLISRKEDSDLLYFILYAAGWIQLGLLPIEASLSRWHPDSWFSLIMSKMLTFSLSISFFVGEPQLPSQQSGDIVYNSSFFGKIYLMMQIGFFVMFVCFLANTTFKKTKSILSSTMSTISIFLTHLFSTVLLLPFAIGVIVTFSIERSASEELIMVFYPKVKFLSGTVSILNFYLTIVLTIPFVIYIMLTYLFVFDFKCTSNRIFSRSPSYINLFQGISLILMVTARMFVFRKVENELAFEILCLTLSIAMLISILYRNPFHRQLVRKFAVFASMTFTWNSLISFAVIYFVEQPTIKSPRRVHDSSYLYLEGLLIIVIYSFTFNNLSTSFFKHWVPVEPIHHSLSRLRNLLRVSHWVETDSRLSNYFSGSIELHVDECRVPSCPFYQSNNDKDRKYSDYLKANKQAAKEFIKETFISMIIANPDDFSVRFDFMLFQLEHLNNYEASLSDIEALSRRKGNIIEEFLIYYCRILIEHSSSVESMKLKGSIPESVSTSNQLKEHFESQLEVCCSIYNNFWSKYLNVFPQVNDALANILLIQQKVHEVNLKWEEISGTLKNNYVQFLALYAKFLLNVVHDMNYGEELITRAKLINSLSIEKKSDIQPKYSKEDIKTISLPFVIASISKQRFASVLAVNTELCIQLGYREWEILDTNVNFLCPQIYREYHDGFVLRSLASGSNKYEKRQKLIYCVDRFSNMMQTTITAKVVADSELMVAKLRFQKDFNLSCIFLVNQDGVIENVSSSASLFFNRKYSLRGTHINDLVPSLSAQVVDGQLRSPVPKARASRFDTDDLTGEVFEFKYSEASPRFFIFKYSRRNIRKEINLVAERKFVENDLQNRFKFYVDPKSERITTTFKKLNYSALINPVTMKEVVSVNTLRKVRKELSERIVIYQLQDGQLIHFKENATEENLVLEELKQIPNTLFLQKDRVVLKKKGASIISKFAMINNTGKHKSLKFENSLKIQLILMGLLFFGGLIFLALVVQFFSDVNDINQISDGILVTQKFVLGSIHLQQIQMASTHILINCAEPLDYMPPEKAFQVLNESINRLIDCEKMVTTVLKNMSNSVLRDYFITKLFKAKLGNSDSDISMSQIVRQFISNAYILSQSETCKFNYKSSKFLELFTFNLFNYFNQHFTVLVEIIKKETLEMSGSQYFMMTNAGVMLCVLGMVIFSVAYILVTDNEKFMLIGLFAHLLPSQIQVILHKIDNFLKEMANTEIDISIHSIKANSESELAESKKHKEKVKLMQKLKPLAYFLVLPLLVLFVSWYSANDLNTMAMLGHQIQHETSWSMINYFNYAQLYNLNLLNLVNSSLTVNFTDVSTFLNSNYDSVYVSQSAIFETQFEQVDFSNDYFAFTNELLFDNITSVVLSGSLPEENNTLISDENALNALNLTKNPGLVPFVTDGLTNFHLEILEMFTKMRGAASYIDDLDSLFKTFDNPGCKNPVRSRFCIFHAEDFKALSYALMILYYRIIVKWNNIINSEFKSNVVSSMTIIRIRHLSLMFAIILSFIAIFLLFTMKKVNKETRSIKSILGMVVYENLGSVYSPSFDTKEPLKVD